MIKSYLLITIRSLWKNKTFILINVIGMGIAIACCIVSYYNYDFNATFDGNHAHASSIYRVNSVKDFQNQLTEYGYVPEPLGEAIRQYVSDVDKVIRFFPEIGDFKIGDEI